MCNIHAHNFTIQHFEIFTSFYHPNTILSLFCWPCALSELWTLLSSFRGTTRYRTSNTADDDDDSVAALLLTELTSGPGSWRSRRTRSDQGGAGGPGRTRRTWRDLTWKHWGVAPSVEKIPTMAWWPTPLEPWMPSMEEGEMVLKVVGRSHDCWRSSRCFSRLLRWNRLHAQGKPTEDDDGHAQRHHGYWHEATRQSQKAWLKVLVCGMLKL
jgi:hypothetical protein